MRFFKNAISISCLIILFAGVSLKSLAQSKISIKQTKATFDLFWGKGASADLVIDKYDKDRAIDLLIKLIEGSCDFSTTDELYSFNSSISSVSKRIYTKLNGCDEAIKNGKYAESVRKVIALEYKSAFEIRKQTGEW
jgi:hypothetical protein